MNYKTKLGICYLQLHDKILRIEFQFFHELLEDVINRPIQTIEFATPQHLIKEIERLWEEEIER